jgi:hypothetical protein
MTMPRRAQANSMREQAQFRRGRNAQNRLPMSRMGASGEPGGFAGLDLVGRKVGPAARWGQPGAERNSGPWGQRQGQPGGERSLGHWGQRQRQKPSMAATLPPMGASRDATGNMPGAIPKNCPRRPGALKRR